MGESDDNKRLAENPVGDELLKGKMLNEIGEHLRGDYGCTRIWEAWQVGTMTEEDFYPLEESERVEELADLFMKFLEADRERAVAEAIEYVIGEDEDLNAPAETYGKDDQSLGDNPYPNPNLQYVVRRATRNVFRYERRERAKQYLAQLSTKPKQETK